MTGQYSAVKRHLIDERRVVALDSLVDLFIESFEQAPTSIVLDVDASDDSFYGQQEGRAIMVNTVI